MCLKCIKSSLTLFIFIGAINCFGQFTSYRKQRTFLIHLEEEKLFNERIFLLSQMNEPSSSTIINLERAWTFHALGKLELSKNNYEQVPFDSVFHYNFHSDYLSLLYKEGELTKIRNLLNLPTVKGKEGIENFNLGLSFLALKFSVEQAGSMDIPDNMKEVYKKNLSIQKKSPALAGIYSAVIPGLGKAYYGKKKEALNAFAASLIFGLQAYESYIKAGLGSARFIIFGTGFSFFYLSNIYGAISGLIKSKKDWRKQLYYEVGYRYYNTNQVVHPAYN